MRGDDDVEYGPVAREELREWVVENRVGLGTAVRLEDEEENWRRWQDFPELVALLAEVHATGRVLPPLPPALPVLAPFGRRVGAFVLDLILSFVVLAGLVFILYWFLPVDVLVRMELFSQAFMAGLNPEPPKFPFWFQVAINSLVIAVPILYYGGFHAAHGRTPAKSILRVQVVDARGLKPTPGKAFVRALVFFVCVYFLYCIPLVYAFFNPQRRALHDVAAGTYVVEL